LRDPVGYSKKREYKQSIKEMPEMIPFDIDDRRRSSRLRKDDKTPAVYTIDKMN
jgi:hypothetical protein